MFGNRANVRFSINSSSAGEPTVCQFMAHVVDDISLRAVVAFVFACVSLRFCSCLFCLLVYVFVFACFFACVCFCFCLGLLLFSPVFPLVVACVCLRFCF